MEKVSLSVFVILICYIVVFWIPSSNKKNTILRRFRRFAVINTRTDKIVFELTGDFECKKISDKQIEIEMIDEIEMIEPHKKYLIGLNKDLMYIVEEIDKIIELKKTAKIK